MYEKERTENNMGRSVDNSTAQTKGKVNSFAGFVDNRPQAAYEKKIQEIANNSPIQRKVNISATAPGVPESDHQVNRVSVTDRYEDPAYRRVASELHSGEQVGHETAWAVTKRIYENDPSIINKSIGEISNALHCEPTIQSVESAYWEHIKGYIERTGPNNYFPQNAHENMAAGARSQANWHKVTHPQQYDNETLKGANREAYGDMMQPNPDRSPESWCAKAVEQHEEWEGATGFAPPNEAYYEYLSHWGATEGGKDYQEQQYNLGKNRDWGAE